MWLTRAAVFGGAPSAVRGPTYKLPQDRCAAWYVPGATVLAVADGVGSAARPSEAATLAVALCQTRTLGADFNEYREDPSAGMRALGVIFGDVRAEFLKLVGGLSDAGQWQSTLAIAVIVGRSLVLAASVGDSFLAVGVEPNGSSLDEGALWPVTFEAQPAAGEQRPPPYRLDSEMEHVRCKALWLPRLESVVLSTDGLIRTLVPVDRAPGAIQVDPRLRQLTEAVRDERGYEVERILAERGLGEQRADDQGVAIAAWR